jgi:hypothetical protein
VEMGFAEDQAFAAIQQYSTVQVRSWTFEEDQGVDIMIILKWIAGMYFVIN